MRMTCKESCRQVNEEPVNEAQVSFTTSGHNFSSCKVFGDHWHLRGGLLGAPQLCPLWVECNPGEDAQRLTTRRTPPPPRRLLTRSDALSAPVVHPATAQRLAGPLAAARIDARRPMRLAARPPGRLGLRGVGLHGPAAL